MELEVCFNWFLQTPKQLFKIENIYTNNLPLWVEPLIIMMCSIDIHHLGLGTKHGML